MPTTDLHGLNILVTRPEHQAAPLCRLIEAARGQALTLPLLTIHDTSRDPAVAATLSRLNGYHLAIFISPNAVRYGIDAVERRGGLPPQLQLAAVGQGSARALAERTGRQPDLVPTERFDSEGLLALPPLQQLDGRRVVIFRGNGGRELLAETLCQRGAEVDYAEVYRRDCPAALAADDERLAKADIILITSGAGLDNLVAMTPPAQRPRLFTTPLLLVSERTVTQARQLGFQAECLLSPRAADEAILDTLLGWAQQRPSTKTEQQQ